MPKERGNIVRDDFSCEIKIGIEEFALTVDYVMC